MIIIDLRHPHYPGEFRAPGKRRARHHRIGNPGVWYHVYRAEGQGARWRLVVDDDGVPVGKILQINWRWKAYTLEDRFIAQALYQDGAVREVVKHLKRTNLGGAA